MFMDPVAFWMLRQYHSIVKNTVGNGNDVSRLVEGIESYNLEVRGTGRQPFSRACKDIITKQKWFDDFVGRGFKESERGFAVYRFVYATEDLGKVVGLHVIHMHVNAGRNASYSVSDHTLPAEILCHCGSIDPMVLSPGGKKEMEGILDIILSERDSRTKLMLWDFGIPYNATHDIRGWFKKPIRCHLVSSPIT